MQRVDRERAACQVPRAHLTRPAINSAGLVHRQPVWSLTNSTLSSGLPLVSHWRALGLLGQPREAGGCARQAEPAWTELDQVGPPSPARGGELFPDCAAYTAPLFYY